MFFAKFNKSCLVTYMGILFAVIATWLAFNKMAFSDVIYVRYSLACLVLSGICDMFDGKFARLFKRTDEEKNFGVQLDSLADTFCFLAVPLVYVMSIGMLTIWDTLIGTTFIICGVSRLGYFNIKLADTEKAIKTYSGLPVTATAIAFPLVGLLHPFVSLTTFKIVNLVIMFIDSLLMVVNIKIPKLKGIANIIIPILAAILIALLIILR